VAGSIPDRRIASRTRSAWALGFGTVYPAVRPPALTVLPLTTAQMSSPSTIAASSGLSSTAPTPSPGTYPSARSSNTLHAPSAASMFSDPNAARCAGCRITLTPPAIAIRHSPRRRLSTARCTAVSDDEHAESTAKLGPCRSSVYDTRLAIDQ
jgi:hypothetical protein